MMQLTIIQKIAIWALPVLFAIIVHEVAHGWVASLFGDQTARLSGRLSLNPLKHIDPVGTILVPILLLLFSNFIFGWAKPVPIDARNMKNPRRDMALVALAGPVANFLMALIWAGIAKIGMAVSPSADSWFVPLVYMGEAGIMINIVLGVLNCLPIPPLDGGRVLYNVLPPTIAYRLYKLEAYGFLILLLLILSGVLSYLIAPIIFFLTNIIAILFGLS